MLMEHGHLKCLKLYINFWNCVDWFSVLAGLTVMSLFRKNHLYTVDLNNAATDLGNANALDMGQAELGVLASAALPIIFPAERIGNEYFGDGGMRMVAPLSPAIHLGANTILVIGTRDEKPDPPSATPAQYPSAGEIGGYLMDTIFMDTLNADLARMRRINKTMQLVPEELWPQAGLKNIDSLVIKPSQDLRHVTQAHVRDIPLSVQMLLRTLGGWGRDWRIASYLLFESAYCGALIDLGYVDGMNAEQDIRQFLKT